MFRATILIFAVAFGMAILGLQAVQATITEAPVTDAEVAGPAWLEQGVWRTKVQQVFDPGSRTLSRRTYTMWDPQPSRDLDYVWVPDSADQDQPGPINGSGHLVWRIKGRPTYDKTAIFAQYRGTITQGRIGGQGAYLDHTGLYYEGHWNNGLMEGHGTLKLPGGDEYTGAFQAGKAHGVGRFTDVTGEVYEGPFVNGQRHGSGTTTLQNDRSYVSVWSQGREAQESRLIRLVQAPGKGLPGGTDDIRIGVTVDKKLPPRGKREDERDSETDLTYAISNSKDRMLLRPDNKRLMSVWKEGGEIQLQNSEMHGADYHGVVSFAPGQLLPLTLSLELQNRSNSQIRATGAYLDVKTSATDNQPALQLESNIFDISENQKVSLGFTLSNFGWGSAVGGKISYDFFPATKGARRPGTRNLSVPRIDRKFEVSFEETLKSEGVDVDYLNSRLEQGFDCPEPPPNSCNEKVDNDCSSHLKTCLADLRKSGKFGALAPALALEWNIVVTYVLGSFSYDWTDSNGVARSTQSPFATPVALGHFKQGTEEGEGGERQIVTTKAIQLKLDRSNYRLPVSFQAALPPGRTSRWSFPIAADKASQHQFIIVVQLEDGREIRSRPIDLLYYVPSWHDNEKGRSNGRPPINDESSDDETAEDDPKESTFIDRYDLAGTDLRQIKNVESYDCSDSCKKDQACRAISYDTWNRWCFLKSNTISLRFDPKYSATLMPGVKRPAKLTTTKVIERYRNQAFPDVKYGVHLRGTMEDCERLCATDSRCAALTFTKSSALCHLMDSVGPSAGNSDTDSGVKRQPVK
jgi:hypothetical protein